MHFCVDMQVCRLHLQVLNTVCIVYQGYPSSKPDQKTSIMPSLSEHNFNSYSKLQPMQLQTFNTPQDDIATMNVGYSTQPVHDNGYNKYPQNNFDPNQANGDHDRNGNTQIRSNGEYIHVSPSKQNYQCENSKESPDLGSTLRSPEHEKSLQLPWIYC